MSAYFVAQININNYEEYQKYLDNYNEVFEKYKGEVVAVDDNPTTLEGNWNYSRIVLIRFPNEDELRKWYDSQDYKRIVRHRWDSSEADVLIVKGR